MKYLLFLCTLPLILLKEPTNISGIESPIKLPEKGNYHYQVDFPSVETHGTYYIATELKDKDSSKADVSLFLGGNCLEECSNLVEFPDKENNCGKVNEFLGKYHFIKLFPNQVCTLYFTIETSDEIELLIHYQPTLQINEIQTIPLMFAIPSAPIFLEYIPKFPATFVSLAKIYVNPAEKKDIDEVYFGKDADHQDCNTHFPDKEKHCFTFKLPSYENPNSYFIAFSYVTVYTSNVYIGIYPANAKVKETKVTIGYTMPFVHQGVKCPEKSQLMKFNEDIYCLECCEHCEECYGEKCEKCEKGYALFQGKCEESECENFGMYKNKEGKCVECKENCKYCEEEKCLECKEEFVLVEGNCEMKKVCESNQYYNKSDNKCEDCMIGCESCIDKDFCEKCEDGFFYSNVDSECLPSPVCKACQYLSDDKKECLDCSEKCEKCTNAKECIKCEEGFAIQGGICVKDCGAGKFYNEEKQKCERCIKNCKQCSDEKTCDNCKVGNYLTDDKQCKESPLCKPGYYLTSKRDECKKCPNDCTSCKNETFCQNCKIGYSIVGHQVCAPSCSKYSFYQISEQKCIACIDHCENCLDGQTCEKCRVGFKYHIGEGKCIQTLSARMQSALNLAVGFAMLFLFVLVL